MSNQKVLVFKKGEIIFEEGSIDPTLYEVEYGTVGIVKDHNKDTEVLIARIQEGYFGENGLAENTPRNATAVALEETGLLKLDAEAMKEHFTERPGLLELLIESVSDRIRTADRKYIKACEAIDQFMAAELVGKPQEPELIEKMRRLVSGK